MCLGGESSFRVLVHCACELFYAHLAGRFCLDGGSPRPASFSGRWTHSVGKFWRIPIACRMPLLRMTSIVERCRSQKTLRWVAWYFDFRN
jgi:hypothetical protein